MEKLLQENIEAIKSYIYKNYKNNFREPSKRLPFPYLVPGANYSQQLWDWDSWLTGVALFEIDDPEIEKYEKGCVLDFIHNMDEFGRIPILVQEPESPFRLFELDPGYKSNIHKPCLAMHAYEISVKYGSFTWLNDVFNKLLQFISYYENNQYHKESGLYFWLDDLAIGFDNDPTVFYRQDKTSCAIYLNSLMYGELKAISEIAANLNKPEIAKEYKQKADDLANAIRKECFDKIDGYFYSASCDLRPVDSSVWLHSGHPRNWSTLPIKIATWAGMLPLYNKIATQEEADRVVKFYQNEDGLYSKYGIRSVAKYEKMFANVDSGNPSCWLGPIWINANYFTYVALKNYGYNDLAKEIAIKTINLLGNDVRKYGEFHEYYHSETGEGIRGLGFQSWNFLVLKIIKDLENE